MRKPGSTPQTSGKSRIPEEWKGWLNPVP